MNAPRTRREFLTAVGQGMVAATVGAGLAGDLGLGVAWAEESAAPLAFGPLEPLVVLLQETPVERLMPTLVERLNSGTRLESLVAAAALANARTFGGEDYVGFHTMMALAPAWHMSRELPDERRPLPVLKVLYRNTNRIHEHGGRASEVLHPVAAKPAEGSDQAAAIQALVRAGNVEAAEAAFAAVAERSPTDAFDTLLYTIEDRTDVHRVVMPYRAWDLLGLVGREHAHTLLRQSIRYCVDTEKRGGSRERDEPRTVLPKVLDEHRLAGRTPGTRSADDAWVENLSMTIFSSPPAVAADAVGAALAEGFAPDAIGEAIALAANQLVLRDPGRKPNQEWPGKPIGSVHGDSIGVHGSDSANAWRNMARVGSPRNQYACLILGAFHVAVDRSQLGGEAMLEATPLPVAYYLNHVTASEPEALLAELDAAIRGNLQSHAAAIAARYGQLGHPARPLFDVLLRYAISEDGALHGEKYYRTVSEEFATARPAFRWRQLVALARVTASEYGRPAAGCDEAQSLLKLA